MAGFVHGFGQPAILRGTITDAVTGKAIAGVHIILQLAEDPSANFHTVTGAQGEYQFTRLNSGEYKFSATLLGYTRISQQVTLIPSEEKVVDLGMEQEYINMGEIVVTSARMQKYLRDQCLPLAVITSKSIENTEAFSLADHLSREPGLAVARDGIWGASVNIRGMSEDRIVTLIDGNRVETATDLAAGLSLVDLSDIERVEVIKGAASSLYGSGAMGGVVNIITRQGFFSDPLYLGGNMSASFSSVNKLLTDHLSLMACSPKLYARLTGSFRVAGNAMTPRGVLENSQFSDQAVSVKLGARTASNQELHLSFQEVDAKDVGIPGGKAFPATATATYPKETRQLVSTSYEINNLLPSLKKTSVNIFYQYILRDVILEPKTPPVTPPGQRITVNKMTPTGNHYTTGARVQTDWEFSSNRKLNVGIDYWQRKLVTEREKYMTIELLDTLGQVTAVNELVRGEVPVPTSVFRSGGIFLQQELDFFEKRLQLTLGGRIDMVRIQSKEARDPLYTILNGTRDDTPANQRITFTAQHFEDLSWSTNIGALVSLAPSLDMTVNIGRSFRAPSLEERFKYIDLGSKVRLGNPQLEAEHGTFMDLGTRFINTKLNIGIDGFLSLLNGLIVEEPGEYIYTYFNVSGDSLVDTLPALVNANVDKAMLYGFDMHAEIEPLAHLVLSSHMSYTRGKNALNDSDLPVIPPLNGSLSVRYHVPGVFQATALVLFAGDQEHVAEGETITHGYTRYDLLMQSDPLPFMGSRFRVFTGIENLTDRSYSNHLSTNRGMVDIEPGRNFFIRIAVDW
jgi:hemoglobin/transferrin/lactoferrin receptor protein